MLTRLLETPGGLGVFAVAVIGLIVSLLALAWAIHKQRDDEGNDR